MVSSDATQYARVSNFEISKFGRNVLHFVAFWNQFDTRVHRNTNLKEIDKFNYLNSCITKAPFCTIHGYSRTVEILHGIYVHSQVLLSSQMAVLVKLPRVKSMHDIPKLRKILNFLEIIVVIGSFGHRFMLTVDMDSYGL